MKKEIRVLGIDDAPFEFDQKEVLVIGTFFRGGQSLDGVLSTYVQKDERVIQAYLGVEEKGSARA